MGDDAGITPEDFAKAFRRVSDWAHIEEREDRSPFKTMLTEHFGADPATYPVTGEAIAPYDLPNLQLALEACGVSCPRDTDMQERALGRSLVNPLDLSQLQRGDLLFWNGHVAIARDTTAAISASSPPGEVI